MRKRYKPYEATGLEERIDSAIRLISPQWHHRRIVAREQANYFRYLAAYSNSARRNTSQLMVGETARGAREKLQVMWNAINMVDNSGLCSSLLWKIAMYVCGTLRWQARTGDKAINDEYEDYMRMKLGRGLDYTGRFSLRTQCMMDIKSILLKGDIGTNIVRVDDEIYLQGIEAERIGDPNSYQVSNNYVRGLRIDDNGVIVAADVFFRDRMSGVYNFDDTYYFRDENGLPKFLFLVNPISYDDYRGISVFKSAIDNSTYIERIREFELQALMWAASQSGVYHTKSGTLPEALPFDRLAPLQDESGNKIDTYQVRPNTVTALGVGEDVKMFDHERPSPNILGMLKETIRDICNGVGVSFALGWDWSGLTGPAARSVSAQDARAFEVWQNLMLESKLDPIAGLILGDAIAKGDLPFHPKWQRWQWFFPPKSTIDAGRESAANISEMSAGVNTGARIAADDSMDIEEIQEQLGHEQQGKIEVAQAVAKKLGGDITWREVYGYMFPPPKGTAAAPGMPQLPRGPSAPPSKAKADARGATSDGADIGDGDGKNGNGQRPVLSLRAHPDGLIEFYRPDQKRVAGRFAYEGHSKEAQSAIDKHGNLSNAIAELEKSGENPEALAELKKFRDSGGLQAEQIRQMDYAGTGGESSYDSRDMRIKQSAYFADAAKYRALKTKWSEINNELLNHIDDPTNPVATAKLAELKDLVKQMHSLKADPGGIEGIGLPGGPKDILVVGAGPGGMSASIMGATDGLDTMFLDKNVVPGGQAKYSSRVENFPGFPIGISGKQLAQNMYDQATRLGADGRLGVGVSGLEFNPKTGLKTITLSNGETIDSRALIIGGGVEFRKLDVPGFTDKTAIYADGDRLTKEGAGKPVVVIGGSNGAAQAALGAARKADHVYILSRGKIGDSMSDYQVQAIRANKKLTVIEGDSAAQLFLDENGEGKELALKSGKKIPANRVGVFIGSNPATGWTPTNFGKVSEGRDKGRLMVNGDLEVLDSNGKVAMPGVFAVGDIRQNTIQRIGGAVGDGQMAERNVFNYLAKSMGVKSDRVKDVSVENARKVISNPNSSVKDIADAADTIKKVAGPRSAEQHAIDTIRSPKSSPRDIADAAETLKKIHAAELAQIAAASI